MAGNGRGRGRPRRAGKLRQCIGRGPFGDGCCRQVHGWLCGRCRQMNREAVPGAERMLELGSVATKAILNGQSWQRLHQQTLSVPIPREKQEEYRVYLWLLDLNIYHSVMAAR